VRTCEVCGTRLDDGAQFCPSCDTFVGWADPERPPGPAAPPPATTADPPAASAIAPPASPADLQGALDVGHALAVQQDRPDLARHLDETRERLAAQLVPVAVVGEFKRGKSTLVNALLRTQVCPVDADVVTAVPTLVRYGETTEVLAHPDPPGAPRRLELSELADAVSELRRTGPRPASVEVRMRHRMLRPGLCLLDTPGVGGLDSAHGVVTLSALDLAQGLVFVTDAAQELTAPEVEFLRMAFERCPTAACVVTKTDLHQHWRRIVELDRGHLERAGLPLPVFAVSSYLRLQPEQDDELVAESGFRPLVTWLATDVVRPASTRATRSAALDVRAAVAELGSQIAAGRAVVARPQEAPRVVARLAEATRRTEQLAAPTTTWQQVLGDRVADLVSDIEHDLRGRIRDVALRVEEVVDRGDPRDTWPDVEAWLRREVAAAMVTTYERMSRGAEEIAADVAARFDLDAGRAGYGRAAPTGVLDRIDVDPPPLPPATSRLMSGVLAARGGVVVPSVLLATASHLAVPLVATLFLAPVVLALGGGLGVWFWKLERRRQLEHLRQLAKATARRYLDQVLFAVDKDCRDTLRLTQRALRDEFQERAATLHRSAQSALAAAEHAHALDPTQRAREAGTLAEQATRLRELDRTAAALAGSTPPEPRRG
jgi:Dynamin family